MSDELLERLRANPDLDVYAIGVEWLRANPESIQQAWVITRPGTPPEARALFQYVVGTAGCLTQVKWDDGEGVPPDIGEQIVCDNRVPDHPGRITPGHLEHFADWQRYLDELFPDMDRGVRAEVEAVYR